LVARPAWLSGPPKRARFWGVSGTGGLDIRIAPGVLESSNMTCGAVAEALTAAEVADDAIGAELELIELELNEPLKALEFTAVVDCELEPYMACGLLTAVSCDIELEEP
jgi:hypothetical protein